MEKKNGKFKGMIASQGLGMLKKVGSLLKRSDESRQCIDNAKSQGASGREARQVCRDRYGSRLGNAGRKLGILPQEAKGLKVSQFAQKLVRGNTPNKFGMTNEQFILPGGGSGTGNGVMKSGFNYLYLLPLLLFVPQIQKLFK